jgi:hypothetical protein
MVSNSTFYRRENFFRNLIFQDCLWDGLLINFEISNLFEDQNAFKWCINGANLWLY